MNNVFIGDRFKIGKGFSQDGKKGEVIGKLWGIWLPVMIDGKEQPEFIRYNSAYKLEVSDE